MTALARAEAAPGSVPEGAREEPLLYVTLGLRPLGRVYEAGCGFEAVAEDGCSRGVFQNAKAAVGALCGGRP